MSKWIPFNRYTLINFDCCEKIERCHYKIDDSYVILYYDKTGSIMKSEDFKDEKEQLKRFEEIKKLLLSD